MVRKLEIISKFMTLQTRRQIIKLHIVASISVSKGKQIMKFDQLIEHYMHSAEYSPKPFYKNSKLNISLDQQSEMLQSLILLYVKVEVY